MKRNLVTELPQSDARLIKYKSPLLLYLTAAVKSYLVFFLFSAVGS